MQLSKVDKDRGTEGSNPRPLGFVKMLLFYTQKLIKIVYLVENGDKHCHFSLKHAVFYYVINIIDIYVVTPRKHDIHTLM